MNCDRCGQLIPDGEEVATENGWGDEVTICQQCFLECDRRNHRDWMILNIAIAFTVIAALWLSVLSN